MQGVLLVWPWASNPFPASPFMTHARNAGTVVKEPAGGALRAATNQLGELVDETGTPVRVYTASHKYSRVLPQLLNNE